MITPKELFESIESVRNGKGEKTTPFYTNSGAGRSFPDNLRKGRMPSFDKVLMIADYAGVSVDTLLGRDVAQFTPQPEDKMLALLEQLSDESLIELEKYLDYLIWKQDQDGASSE